MTIEFPAQMARIDLIESLEGLAAQYYLYAAERLTTNVRGQLHAAIDGKALDVDELARFGGEPTIKSAERLHELLGWADVREDGILSRVSRIERLLRKSRNAVYPQEIDAETTINRIGVLTRELASGAIDELLAKMSDTASRALTEDHHQEICHQKLAMVTASRALAAAGKDSNPIAAACALLDASRAALAGLVEPDVDEDAEDEEACGPEPDEDEEADTVVY